MFSDINLPELCPAWHNFSRIIEQHTTCSMIDFAIFTLVFNLFFGYPQPESCDSIGFDMGHPIHTMVLSTELREISGMRILGEKILAIEDEHGLVYVLDKTTGEVTDKWEFWDDGDFEDIALYNDFAFVLKSNGNIYRTPLHAGSTDETVKYDLEYGKHHNFEGLAFNPESGCFLLASKRSSDYNEKEIYCQPLDDMEKIADPVYIIDQSKVRDHYRSQMDSWSDRLAFDLGTSAYSFNPSSIAVHPLSGDIYILSSPVPQLLVLTSDWEFISVEFLDRELFKQPESICFDTDGSLYIANEGRSGRSNILKFEPK